MRLLNLFFLVLLTLAGCNIDGEVAPAEIGKTTLEEIQLYSQGRRIKNYSLVKVSPKSSHPIQL